MARENCSRCGAYVQTYVQSDTDHSEFIVSTEGYIFRLGGRWYGNRGSNWQRIGQIDFYGDIVFLPSYAPRSDADRARTLRRVEWILTTLAERIGYDGPKWITNYNKKVARKAATKK